MFNKITIILVMICAIILCFLATSFVFYGVGNLIIYVFKLNYVWTFPHGICLAIIITILKSIFRKG